MCTGTIGTFTANEAKKALHLLRWVSGSKARVVSDPVWHLCFKIPISVVPYRWFKYKIPNNILTDPTKVYLKKKYAARIFRDRDPHTPILLYIGINTASNLT
jgi:hypothetical protein